VGSVAIRRTVASLLVAACLHSGCGEPASEVPPAAAESEVVAALEDADPRSDLEPAAGETSAADETGEALYRRLPCAGCHELAAMPGQPVIPLERLSERYTADVLAAFLAAPAPPMPNFNLDPEKSRKLALYLLSAFP